jgi:dTDP-4-dehydrorhamnose reductase
MTRLLITGAAGVVGSAVSHHFRRAYPACALADRESCDLESPAAVKRLVDAAEPEIVLHLAGNKDVFALEKDPQMAWRANVVTTQNLIGALKGDAFVVYVSTDYVFEGTAGPYDEASPTHPNTAYGKSKLAAEACLRESGLAVAIARSAALFGFPNDFVTVVRDSLGAGKPFPAFSDLVSNPTYVDDFAAMLSRIMERRLAGVFHLCGSEPLSREQFARRIAGAFGLDAGLIRGERRTERVRPPDLSLSNAATCATLGYRPRSLEDALAAVRKGQPQPAVASGASGPEAT